MGINIISKKIDGVFSLVNTNFNKFISLINIKSIKNTNLNFDDLKNKNIKPTLSISNFIEKCNNKIDIDRYSIASYGGNKEIKLSNPINLLEGGSEVNDNNLDNITKLSTDKKERVNKLPDWVTNSGLDDLNTNEKLRFNNTKIRSFKNLIKKITSPANFLNRVLLPVNINCTNSKLAKDLNEIELNFDNMLDNNISFNEFSKGLKEINNTFNENINEVRSKDGYHGDEIDGRIKYYTLEKALECKFINDVNKLKNELKRNLAKDKFEENYSNLPSKIKRNLDVLFNENMNNNIDKLFSYDVVNELKSFLKENVMNEHKSTHFDHIVMNVFDSVMSEEGKEAILKERSEGIEYVKKELSLNITKSLFNYLSKDNYFIGEEESFDKINKYIYDKSESMSKYISKSFIVLNNKTIKALENSFFDNIKSNDNGNDLLTRLFRNSSNNINYKWAQDAVVLLINYETFSDENKNRNIKKYTNNGVANNGGAGSSVKELSVLEGKLEGIFKRLGLNGDDLEESKDAVLRKYLANYF